MGTVLLSEGSCCCRICDCCSGDVPATVNVTFGGTITQNGGVCTDEECGFWLAGFTLEYTEDCTWELDVTFPCDGLSYNIRAQPLVTATPGCQWTVDIRSNVTPAIQIIWRGADTPDGIDCEATEALGLFDEDNGFIIGCDFSAVTCTVN